MDAVVLERVVDSALSGIDLSTLPDWEDEIRGAAAYGVAKALGADPGADESLLVTSARHAAIDEWRKEVRRRGNEITAEGEINALCKRSKADPYELADAIDDGEANPPRDMAQAELMQQLPARVQALPAQEREAIELVVMRGRTLAQAAKVMALPRWRVDELVSSGIGRLREQLGVG